MLRVFLVIILLSSQYEMNSQSKMDYPIYFAYKVAEMDTTEEKRLVFFLKNFDSFTIDSISIKGYCDDRGRKKINDTLAKKRAETIYRIISSRIKYSIPNEILAFGAVPLEGELKIDSQRTLNRRAELELFYSMTRKKTSPPKAKIPSPPIAIAPLKDTIIDSNTIPNIKNFLQSAKIGESINLKIYFKGGSSELIKNSSPELKELLQIMKDNPNRNIKITGHIHRANLKEGEDGFDYKTRNNFLSSNRAKTVYTYLTNNGIDKERLSYEGMRSKFPKNKNPEDDRRVEIQIVG